MILDKGAQVITLLLTHNFASLNKFCEQPTWQQTRWAKVGDRCRNPTSEGVVNLCGPHGDNFLYDSCADRCEKGAIYRLRLKEQCFDMPDWEHHLTCPPSLPKKKRDRHGRPILGCDGQEREVFEGLVLDQRDTGSGESVPRNQHQKVISEW